MVYIVYCLCPISQCLAIADGDSIVLADNIGDVIIEYNQYTYSTDLVHLYCSISGCTNRIIMKLSN